MAVRFFSKQPDGKGQIVPRNTSSEVPIATIIRAMEAGASAVEISRKYDIAETTYYRWKRKY